MDGVTQVSVEGQLWVEGRFASHSVGGDKYYHNNKNDSYDTAWEKAKSNLLMRCCKEFGIFREMWDKDWLDANKSHFRKSGEPVRTTVPQAKPATSPKPAEPAPNPNMDTDDRLRFLDTVGKMLVDLPEARRISVMDGLGKLEKVTSKAMATAYYNRCVKEKEEADKLTKAAFDELGGK